MQLQLPEGFLLGVSSASAQIEGGDVGNNWNDWYHRGRIKDGSDPAVADDHWNRWREDCALMAGLQLPVARLGVEWARIMPARGQIDETAVAHYRAELEYMKQLGIRPLLTIHHFSNPMWFERMGAFAKRENLDDFLSFAKLCADRFGDLVSDWITINEPNVYATNGYFFGDWPPGHMLRNSKEIRELRKSLRKIEKKLAELGYEASDLNARVAQNLDFARANMKANIYDQAVLEGVATSFPQTEDIIDNGVVSGMTANDIQKILNLKHAWEFILDSDVIQAKSDYYLLCHIAKLVNEGFFADGGRIRSIPVTIGGSSYKPPMPIESVVKEKIQEILTSEKDTIDIAIELCMCKKLQTDRWVTQRLDI